MWRTEITMRYFLRDCVMPANVDSVFWPKQKPAPDQYWPDLLAIWPNYALMTINPRLKRHGIDVSAIAIQNQRRGIDRHQR